MFYVFYSPASGQAHSCFQQVQAGHAGACGLWAAPLKTALPTSRPAHCLRRCTSSAGALSRPSVPRSSSVLQKTTTNLCQYTPSTRLLSLSQFRNSMNLCMPCTSQHSPDMPCTHLDESDVLGQLPEALPVDVQAVLANEAPVAARHAAAEQNIPMVRCRRRSLVQGQRLPHAGGMLARRSWWRPRWQRQRTGKATRYSLLCPGPPCPGSVNVRTMQSGHVQSLGSLGRVANGPQQHPAFSRSQTPPAWQHQARPATQTQRNHSHRGA